MVTVRSVRESVARAAAKARTVLTGWFERIAERQMRKAHREIAMHHGLHASRQ